MSYRISEKQKLKYDKEGFFVAKSVIGEEALGRILDRIDEYHQNPEKMGIASDTSRADGKKLSGKEGLRKLIQVATNDEVLWENYIIHPNMLDIHRQMEGEDVALRGSNLFCKAPGVGEPTPWHQDIALWQKGTEINRPIDPSKDAHDIVKDSLNIWMALTRCTVENGCLQVIPRTHTDVVHPHPKYEGAIHQELDRDIVKTREAEAISIELEPGDCLVWHSHLWHFSPANKSTFKRWGLAHVTMKKSIVDQLTCKELYESGERKWVLQGGEAAPFIHGRQLESLNY